MCVLRELRPSFYYGFITTKVVGLQNDKIVCSNEKQAKVHAFDALDDMSQVASGGDHQLWVCQSGKRR